MAANKQTDRHTHARAQCSHASMGLAQARPKQCLCSQCAAIPCINQTSFHDVVDSIITPEALHVV